MRIPRYSGEALGNHALLTQTTVPIIYVEDSALKTAIDIYCIGEFNIQVAGNWKAVARAVDKASAEHGKSGVYGFIDKDYHAIHDYEGVFANPKIIKTDFRDIEIDMLESGAARKLIIRHKVATSKDANRAYRDIMNSISLVSKFRAYNHLKRKAWKFNCYDIYKAWSKRKFNTQSFIASLFRVNNLKEEDKIAVESQWREQEIDLRNITRGHDFVSFFVSCINGNKIAQDNYIDIRTDVEDTIILSAESNSVSKLRWVTQINELSTVV